MLLPTAANAETWWLIVGGRDGGAGSYSMGTGLIKVPMSSEKECEISGSKLMDSEVHGKIYKHMRFSCIKGK